MKKYLVILLLIGSSALVFRSMAQEASTKQEVLRKTDQLSFGLGIGLDYGGLGCNFLYYPAKSIGLFAGAGYPLAGFGFNAGLKIRIVPEKSKSGFVPYGLIMYGYNAAIAVQNASRFNKLFYGPTVGLGFEFLPRQSRSGFWTFALLVPVRSAEVDKYMDDLEENHGVQFDNRLFPVGFSLGYRWLIR